MTSTVSPIRWCGDRLELLDQRRLPHQVEYLLCRDAQSVAAAIHDMAVRGAPAIGIAAAYGLVLAAKAGEDWARAHEVLAQSRPTAVNLHWALQRMAACHSLRPDPAKLEAEAVAIHDEDRLQNLAMAEHGAALLPEGARVLTHCNTGALATGGHGTALGVIRSAHSQGRLAAVYATETRPWLQGARLTAWELQQEGIPAQLLVDGAAASLMARGLIDWVIVGADRIAANGDTANKIGTYSLACAAAQNDVGVMVVAPSGTFDLDCPDGGQIPIEERSGSEVLSLAGQPVAAAGTQAVNPVFDVTPAELIRAVVCERGAVTPPTREGIKTLLRG